MRFARITAALLVGMFLAVACSSSPDGQTGAAGDQPVADVEIRTFQFRPDALEMSVGTKVVWTNRDDIDHTATSGTPDSPDGTFDGAMNEQGDTASFTFAEPGTYPYYCRIHNGMRGEIRVT